MTQIIVVKIGGVASDNLTEDFFKQLRKWKKLGKKVILVHGGGHYITTMMERLNFPLSVEKGVRVTSPEVLEVVKMVLLGQVQPGLITALTTQGFPAVGLSAADHHLLTGEHIAEATLGQVGKVTQVKSEVLLNLLAQDIIPVVAPLGLTANGEWLNINADVTASAIASALGAEKLYLLTDVPGIKYHDQLLKRLSLKLAAQMEAEGAFFGGMLPKVEQALWALKHGVKTVHITDRLQGTGTTLQ